MRYLKITSLIRVNGVSMADELRVKTRSKTDDKLADKAKAWYATRPVITFVEIISVELSDPNVYSHFQF